MRRWAVLGAVVVAVILVGITADLSLPAQAAYPSPSCQALSIGWNSVVKQPSGFAYLCGKGTASDEKVKISLNSYRFANGDSIDWVCSNNSNGSSCATSGVYLLANITFANVGRGNTSVSVFWANVTKGQEQVGNSEYFADALFPGQYPDQSLPDTNGSVFLPPGNSVTYWSIFYLPNTTANEIPYLTLHTILAPVGQYGGDWVGNNGFSCVPTPCDTNHTELIVVPS